MINLIMVLMPVVALYAQDEREVMTRKLVKNMAAKDFEAVQADFSQSLKEQLTPQMIGQVWSSVITNIGEYDSITSITEQTVQGYKVILARCKFVKGNASIEAAFDDKNKVAGLHIKP